MTLIKLNNKIIKCRECIRLVNFREKIATEKRRQYIDQKYWGKPITGYGDINSQLLMIGLAPAAHGGNRTGRVFTGDKSADFLFKCLHNAGFANQSISISRDDGLKLNNLYLTTALKCVPPEDKPKSDELKTCFNFFREEINYLKNINTIVALGKISRNIIKEFNGTVIAVTGSNGKTTTTNIIASTLKESSSTIENFNNEIGMPLSLINASFKSKQ